jgi:peptidoglycan/LPS O-acetylase OafA/YrhL
MTDGDGVTGSTSNAGPSGSTVILVDPRPNGGAEAEAAPPTPGEGERRDGRRLAYNPALDGIRGLAVGAVLLFHGGFSWARGGYLGVSTFFTLSGFLITTLLLAEHRGSGRIGITRFWARRLRRLLPAAAATLGALMLTAFFTDELWERTLGGDVVAAALNVANWRFLFEDRSYAALFDAPSPVLHFWSLAIEEQFYWAFPLLTAGVLAVGRGSLRIYGAVLAGLLGASAVLTLVFSDRHDTVYYATPTRMGEILVGALLAIAVFQGRFVGDRDKRWVPALGALGALALIASVWAWWNIEQDTNALYQGGLLAYAAVSGCLVLAACVPGPVQRALSFEPLRLLGVISYGTYLIHWPVFLLLDEDRVDRLLEPFNRHPRGWELFTVRLAVTLAVAILSYRLLERPIRRGVRPRKLAAPPLAAGAVAGVVLLAVVVPRVSEPPPDPFVEAQRQREEFFEALEGLDPSELVPDSKIGVTLGDSTGLMTFLGLSSWGNQSHRLVLVGGGGGVGCGIGHGGDVRYGNGGPGPVDSQPHCRDWESDLGAAADRAYDRYGRLDVAVVQSGPWDVADRRLEGDSQWRHIGDPVYDEYLRGELENAADLLLGRGATVVWLTAPYTYSDRPESEPARMDAFNDMVRELAAEKEGLVLVDLAGWLQSLPPGEDARLRPDGVHFSADPPTNLEVAERWLGEQIMTASTLERPPAAATAAAGP